MEKDRKIGSSQKHYLWKETERQVQVRNIASGKRQKDYYTERIIDKISQKNLPTKE